MNKTEFIDAIASDAEVSAASAKKVWDAIENIIAQTIKKGGDSINITNFGTFKATHYDERTMTSPLDPKSEIVIPAGFRVSFKAGKGLKTLVNASTKKKKNKKEEAVVSKKAKAKTKKVVVEDDDDDEDAPVIKKSKTAKKKKK